MKWHKFRSAYVEGQWISPFYVQLDRLGKIAATTSVMTDHAAEEYDGYFLPGIPNGHSHSFQYVMAGLCERVTAGHENDDFWIWREQMYRLANAIQLDDLLSVTTQLYMNMLEHGYTSVAEFNYLHHDLGGKAFGRSTEIGEVMMEAAERSGIRLTLVPVYYKQAAPNQAIKPQQKRFYFDRVDSYLKFLDETVSVALKNYSDVTVGYGLHSLRAAPLDDIKILLSHR